MSDGSFSSPSSSDDTKPVGTNTGIVSSTGIAPSQKPPAKHSGPPTARDPKRRKGSFFC